MISIKCNFDSIILATKVDVLVYLPNEVSYMHDITSYKERYTFEPFKTLFCLHGMWDSAEQWVENTNIVRLAQKNNLALVIPSVGNTFYVNTIYGARFSDFIAEELMGFVRALFPLSEKREDNFVCGMSMGGYGAMRFAFTYPQLFKKALAFSPTPDLAFAARFMHTLGVNPDYIVGNWKDITGSELDLFVIAEKAAERKEELPEIMMICGNKDYLNKKAGVFAEHLDNLGIKCGHRIYEGDHTWEFWDEHLNEAINWLLDKE